ncbi:hypothetical protein ACP70R_030439 [Stipagrostis hirtigluma subsp. patula]
MASTASLGWLLSLLLLLLPGALRDQYLPVSSRLRPNDDDAGAGDEVLHPIVLVPGVSCSKLEARLTEAYRPSVPRCGAMKGKGWFGLWANSSGLAAHDYVPCFEEQMRLVYDPAADDYRNLPGVETRVAHFGSSRGFVRNPVQTDWCLEILRPELERIGYRDGDTLFGAPYDLRHAPPAAGQQSQAYSRYFRQLAALVESASKKNRHRKVIIFGHSFGGMVALEFVRSAPMAWRRRYIKHLVVAAPTHPEAGFVEPLSEFASGTGLLYVPTATALSLRPMWRSFESAIANFPSPAVFGRRRPLVVTRQRNYTAGDMADFIAAVGAGDRVEPFRRREVPKMRRRFLAPMVPVTCINAVGSRTPEQLVYWEGDFDRAPEIVYGDGDKSINLISMLAFDEAMRRQPGQREQFKSIKLHGAEHGTIVTEDWAVKRVIQEILEANQISS